MTDPASLQPWAEVDEDLEETVDGEDVDTIGSEASVVGIGSTASGFPETSWARFQRLAALGIAPQWALVPLGAAACWLLGTALLSSADQPGLPRMHALGIGALMVLAAGVVLLGWLARRGAMSNMLAAMHPNSTAAPRALDGLTGEPELQMIWHRIEQHTENVERRVSELLEAHRQTALELNLVDTQRKQAIDVIHAIADPILAVDAFGQLIHANPASEALFGFEVGDVLRKPIGEVISDDRLLRVIRQSREADTRAAERRLILENGEKLYAATIIPISARRVGEDDGSKEHGVVAILRDVTREREASKKKSEFVAHVVHELRTPLSSIRAYVEMLVDGEAADEHTRKEFYEVIQVSADRLGRMIDNMLNISRIEAGTVRINKEPIAPSLLVKEAVDVMRPQAEEKKITLTAHLTPVVYRVLADRDLLYQAVLNLVSNAVKYTPEGGQVDVRMTPHEENRTIEIEVEDTGVGIPADDLPRMFEKFFRVEANKKMAKGTGLGLNLVKKIVEQVHKGTMTLHSEVGRGSKFGMVLPIMP